MVEYRTDEERVQLILDYFNQYKLAIISFLLFVIISIMIIVGGLTRLTDSGLSITQWQLFSGFLPPLNNADWVMYFNLYIRQNNNEKGTKRLRFTFRI